jgi:hypothetical protein
MTTFNHSAIDDLPISQFTRAHFQSLTRRFLVMASNKGYSSASGLNFSLNHGSLPTDYSCFSWPSYSPFARTKWKTPFLCCCTITVFLSVVVPCDCYSANPLACYWMPSNSYLSHLFDGRCLAMSLQATIIIKKEFFPLAFFYTVFTKKNLALGNYSAYSLEIMKILLIVETKGSNGKYY